MLILPAVLLCRQRVSACGRAAPLRGAFLPGASAIAAAVTAEDADDEANSDISVKVGSGSMTMEATVKAAVPAESVVAYPRIATTVITRENEAMRLSNLP